jgi:hypothetical protein
MIKRLLLAAFLGLAGSALLASPVRADGDQKFRLRAPEIPDPVPAPELDPKLVIGGVAVTAGCVALLLERRRRQKQAG